MKLLIALTPGILIGCAFVETCATIITQKDPAPAPPAAQARHSSVRAPIFSLPEGTVAVSGALAVARVQAHPNGH
ncbi:MAG: hypothetical protein V4726_11390 [Verrucomicrobiota bacterium]